MMPIFIVCVAIAIALFRGGSIRNFATLDLRAIWLAFAAFGLQLVLFSPFFHASIIPRPFIPPLYILSMLLLLLWAGLNWRIPGIPLAGAGFLLNTIAIAVNGGYMPVGLEQARFAGKLMLYSGGSEAVANNSIVLAREQVHLWVLTDIFALPAGVPLANVFSIGDILLFVGIGYLCYATMCRPTALSVPEQQHTLKA